MGGDEEWFYGEGFGPSRFVSLVGITILNARRRLEEDGEIVITLPEQRVVAADLGDVLAPA